MLSMTGWFLLVRSLEALDVDEAEEEASEAVEAAAELSDGLVLPPCGWPLPPAETIPVLPPRSGVTVAMQRNVILPSRRCDSLTVNVSATTVVSRPSSPVASLY